MILYQRIKAPNDVNGNPRRAFIVMSTIDRYADIMTVYDEGFAGVNVLPKDIREQGVELPEIKVTPAEYRSWVRR